MPAAAQQMSPQQQLMQAQALNIQARQAIVKQAVTMLQPIFTQAYTSAPGAVVNVAPRNVGFIKRFIVEVAAVVTNASGPTLTLGPLGPSTFFSNVTFTDLSNQQRINTTGWHLVAVSTSKRRRVFAAANTTDTPNGYGNNYQKVMKAPSSVASTGVANVYLYYEIPVTYTDTDLRGGIYANVVSATMNIQFTVNPNLFATSTADAVQSLYQSSSSTLPTLTSWTMTVYQEYFDQLPTGMTQNGQRVPILPQMDMSIAYLLNNTSVGGFTANNDTPIPYANYRDFMSTTLIYDNAGTLNAGSDITKFQIQAANYTAIINIDPNTQAFITRLMWNDDPPAGMYVFDHRQRPISTTSYGNQQLVVTPSSVTTGATFLVGWEALTFINAITNAGSLYGNG